MFFSEASALTCEVDRRRSPLATQVDEFCETPTADASSILPSVVAAIREADAGLLPPDRFAIDTKVEIVASGTDAGFADNFRGAPTSIPGPAASVGCRFDRSRDRRVMSGFKRATSG